MKTDEILCIKDISYQQLVNLLAKYHLIINLVADQATIPASYWGEPEAGIIGNNLYVRNDTPLHSILHESCHYICMDAPRRAVLNCDAGGGYDEEDAVCYLQILLADCITEVSAQRLMQDMDRWGYSFRLGSTKRWFTEDAEDAKAWLLNYQLITATGQPSFHLRFH